MSAGQFIKDVGPFAVALGSLYVAYANSRQLGREARHHARVETLYQDMLDTLQRRFDEIRKRAGIREVNALPVRDPSTDHLVTRARIRLYASGPITASWDEVHSQLTSLEMGQTDDQLKVTMLHLLAVESSVGELAELMRRDLGVPDASRWSRTWSWVGNRARVVRDRRRLINARSKQSEIGPG